MHPAFLVLLARIQHKLEQPRPPHVNSVKQASIHHKSEQQAKLIACHVPPVHFPLLYLQLGIRTCDFLIKYSISTCQSCPIGTYSSITGASSLAACTQCAAGKYSSTGMFISLFLSSKLAPLATVHVKAALLGHIPASLEHLATQLVSSVHLAHTHPKCRHCLPPHAYFAKQVFFSLKLIDGRHVL